MGKFKSKPPHYIVIQDQIFYYSTMLHVSKEAFTMTSSIWPHIYIYHKNNLTKQYVI